MASDAPLPAENRSGGPIFIVGAMGSGTTLLRLMLDSHEHIAIAQETGFMRAVTAQRQIPFWKFGGEWIGRLGWTDDEFREELRRFYDGIFMRFAKDQGKQRWGDKTPYHTWHMPRAARIFPDAQFIAIVRHPGAVSSSLHDRFNYTWPQAVNHWVRSNMELLHRGKQLGDRVAVCRYEDLVLDPEPTMREVLDWLGEPWSPRVLEHHVVHSERGTPSKVEGSTRSDEPIDVSRISKWADAMDAEGYRVLQQRASQLSEFFGYTVDNAKTMEPLFPTTSDRVRLLTGRDLRKKMAPLGREPFGEWPRPSLANRMLDPRKISLDEKTKKPAAKKGPSESGPAKSGSPKKPAAKRQPARLASSGSTSTPRRIAKTAGKAVWKRLPASTQRRIHTFVSDNLSDAN